MPNKPHKITVNKKTIIDATKVLESVRTNAPNYKAATDPLISEILLSNHITYKYILWTMLLTKCVIPEANALSLQSKADIDNAYDARSICHKSIIPFESEYYQRISSGAEPFLNKPARFKQLCDTNPTRSAKDQALLEGLIKTAHQLNNNPTLALKYLIQFQSKLKEKQVAQKYTSPCNIVNDSAQILKKLYPDCQVTINNHYTGNHQQNKGLDIDIIRNGKIIASAEVKNKSLTVADIESASTTATKKRIPQWYFVYGDQALSGVTGKNIIHVSTLRQLSELTTPEQ